MRGVPHVGDRFTIDIARDKHCGLDYVRCLSLTFDSHFATVARCRRCCALVVVPSFVRGNTSPRLSRRRACLARRVPACVCADMPLYRDDRHASFAALQQQRTCRVTWQYAGPLPLSANMVDSARHHPPLALSTSPRIHPTTTLSPHALVTASPLSAVDGRW